MKMFKGVRNQEEIVREMQKLGYTWGEASQDAYHSGSDWNLFVNDKENKEVLVHVFSGRFCIKDIHSDTIIATDSSYELDNVKWYSDILDAINLPLEQAVN